MKDVPEDSNNTYDTVSIAYSTHSFVEYAKIDAELSYNLYHAFKDIKRKRRISMFRKFLRITFVVLVLLSLLFYAVYCIG